MIWIALYLYAGALFFSLPAAQNDLSAKTPMWPLAGILGPILIPAAAVGFAFAGLVKRLRKARKAA